MHWSALGINAGVYRVPVMISHRIEPPCKTPVDGGDFNRPLGSSTRLREVRSARKDHSTIMTLSWVRDPE